MWRGNNSDRVVSVSNDNNRLSPLLGTVLICFAFGCGSNSSSSVENAPAMTGSVSSEPVSSEIDSSEIDKTAEPSAPELRAIDPGKAAMAETLGTSSASVVSKTKTAVDIPPTVDATSIETVNVEEPTVVLSDEQLAQWQRPNFESLRLLSSRDTPESDFVSCAVSTPDGQAFALGGSSLTLWSISGEKPEHVLRKADPTAQEWSIKSLAISPNGKWLVSGDTDGLLQLWDVGNGQEIISKQIDNNDITQIAISPDASQIATIGYDSEIAIWSVPRLESKGTFDPGITGAERLMFLDPARLVIAGEKTVLWNVGIQKAEQDLSSGEYHFGVATSQDGTLLAFADEQGIQFRNSKDLTSTISMKGGFQVGRHIAFSPDNQYLASVDGFRITIWDLARNQVVQVIDAYGLAIVGLSWLPESNALFIANENGRIRIWGGAKAGEQLKLSPLHSELTMPDVAKQVSASPAQLLAAIDVRTYPRLPNASTVVGNIDMVNYTAPVKPEAAALFYRYFLGKDGWTKLPSDPATPGYMYFTKNGFTLFVSIASHEGEETSIGLVNSGNFDTRWLPKADCAPIEKIFESESTMMYRIKADLTTCEVNLLQKMHEAGWTAYSRLNASYTEIDDSRSLLFLSGCTSMNITISKGPVGTDGCMVQYSKFVTPNSIAIPRDCGFVEFDGSTQPYLVASTSMNLEQTKEFYDKEMAEQGWLSRQRGTNLQNDRGWLSFLRGQRDLVIGLKSLPDGRTLITVGEEVERNSWQLAKQETDKNTAEAKGLQAADFPILNSSKMAKYDQDAKSIDLEIEKTPLEDVANAYTESLGALGWFPDGSGVRDKDYTFVIFKKDDVEIELRARLRDGNATVNIQGDGLLWTKELLGVAKAISYETWLRRNRYMATLDRLSEYEKAMQGIE